MKRRSLYFKTKSNITARLGFIFLNADESMITSKETGLTTLIDGLIRNGQGKEESV